MNETLKQAPRKVFEVIIHGKTYDVYDVHGKEHMGYNGEVKTWWLYYSDLLPEGTVPPVDSEYWEPWSNSINRRLWDIRFKEYNSSKEKWGETRFRSGLNCEMYCNDKLIYSFGTGSLSFAMSKAQYLTVVLSEHCYDFFDQESQNGRKIWFYGLPAAVRPNTSHPGEIGIVPDYSTGIDKKEWWSEFKRRRSNINEKISEDDMRVWDEEEDYSDYINWGDALSDGRIDWFRKTPEDDSSK